MAQNIQLFGPRGGFLTQTSVLHIKVRFMCNTEVKTSVLHINRVKTSVLHIKVRLPVLLCAVKTVEGDFRFCWTISPNVGQTHKENPNYFFYDIYIK